MYQILLDSDSRLRLAHYLLGKERPADIGSDLWLQLIDAKVASVSFADMAILADDYGASELFSILQWPRDERRRFIEDENDTYAILAKRRI